MEHLTQQFTLLHSISSLEMVEYGFVIKDCNLYICFVAEYKRKSTRSKMFARDIKYYSENYTNQPTVPQKIQQQAERMKKGFLIEIL